MRTTRRTRSGGSWTRVTMSLFTSARMLIAIRSSMENAGKVLVTLPGPASRRGRAGNSREPDGAGPQ
ncbi:hypothetical protein QBC98_002906 [Kitasatospora acidiphila]